MRGEMARGEKRGNKKRSRDVIRYDGFLSSSPLDSLSGQMCVSFCSFCPAKTSLSQAAAERMPR